MGQKQPKTKAAAEPEAEIQPSESVGNIEPVTAASQSSFCAPVLVKITASSQVPNVVEGVEQSPLPPTALTTNEATDSVTSPPVTNEDSKATEAAPPTQNDFGRIVPDWVNEENFVGTLAENVEGFVKILKFHAGLTGGAGENYASVLLRVKTQVELKDGSAKDLDFMLKTVTQSEQGAMMTNMMGVFPKETIVYGKCLPEFEEMYRNVGKKVTFGPKYYTLKNIPSETPHVLLEDLGQRGFKNVNRLEGLDKEHTEAVLRLLAQMHAASAVRIETKGDFETILMESMFKENMKDIFEAMGKAIRETYLKCVPTFKNGMDYFDKVKNLQDHQADLFIPMGTADLNDFNVLTHGDLWANNVMFRHSDQGKLEETMFVDFQVTRYASPAVDLHYFLVSSTSLDLKTSHFDYFVKYYHDHLVENLRLLNYPKKVPTLRELHTQLIKHYYWSFCTASGVMAAALLDPNENASMDNFLGETEVGNAFKYLMYSNPRYRSHMEVLLPWMDNRGYLDI